MRKDGIRLLCFSAIVWGSLLAFIYVNPYSGVICFSEFVLQLSGSRGEFALGFSLPELVSFAMRMIPYFIFEAYFGIAFYRHFCTASVYVFSRYPHRIKWYLGELVSVGTYACLYQIILLGTVILVTLLRYQLQVDGAGIVLLVYHFLIYFTWLYAMTVLINLLAIRFGSNMSFLLVLGVQISCITLLGCVEIAEQKAEITGKAFGIWLKWNPVSCLVLGWQESSIDAVNVALNQSFSALSLNCSVLFCILLFIVIAFLGAMMVSRHDFLISDAEDGGR